MVARATVWAFEGRHASSTAPRAVRVDGERFMRRIHASYFLRVLPQHVGAPSENPRHGYDAGGSCYARASNRHRLDSFSVAKVFYIYIHVCKNLWSIFVYFLKLRTFCAKLHITRDFYSAKSYKHRHDGGTRVTRTVTPPQVFIRLTCKFA